MRLFNSFRIHKILLLLTIIPSLVQALSYADPSSKVFESADSKLRFVMLVRNAVKTEDGNIYKSSGLYHVDNSEQPIWLLPIGLFSNKYLTNPHLSDDGDYLVVFYQGSYGNEDMYVAFFHKGKLLKNHKIDDLQYEGFDSSKNTYLIKNFRDYYFYDITTGEIDREKHISIPNVKASITFSNGDEVDVSNLTRSSNSYHILREIKEPHIGTGFEGFYNEKSIIIPFNKIKEVNNIRDGETTPYSHDVIMSLTLHDRQKIDMTIPYPNWKISALDNKEKYIKTNLYDLQKIVFLDSDTQHNKESDDDKVFLERLKQFNPSHSWSKIPYENTIIRVVNWNLISSSNDCTPNYAGYGKRAKATCFDIIHSSARGPLMVVVPTGEGFEKPFAIGKYEVSVSDWNKYCILSGTCQANSSLRHSDPMTGITLKQAQDYAAWLSERTDKTYRIPTRAEWEYAANAGGKQPKKDFNCGVTDEDSEETAIQSVESGKSNGWGLKNYIGNVQEWVVESSGKILALGGHYKVDYKECDISFSVEHNGEADDMTGFRILMEMQ